MLSLGMDKQLSLMMRMKLRIHYLMCSFCERYMKQLKYIREVSREFPDKIGEVSEASLPADTKEAHESRASAIDLPAVVGTDCRAVHEYSARPAVAPYQNAGSCSRGRRRRPVIGIGW
ncbi:MAG: hypothetical protein DME58_05555 [Verrucomicrobia bacterium]|nr:MAG: hypothetical protein DME58_05555 [Verrucomicrobiota bacterium]